MLVYSLTSLPKSPISWSGYVQETIHLRQAEPDLPGLVLHLQMSYLQQNQTQILPRNHHRIGLQP